MSRYVVIREGEGEGEGGVERLVEESAVPTEAALHGVLMRHPELIPATDLGFGRVVTVGFEATLASGSADLVLLDDQGRLCIVEVKKEGNPDTRRVIAQLLDYAAALWGLTVEEFDQHVLRRKLGDSDARSLRAFIMEEFFAEEDDAEDAAERALERLGETLHSGDFVLVLAAPAIPTGVERVIEYLNGRGGLKVFGLEVSYFSGTVEAFVPRVVVRPRVPPPPPPPPRPVDLETYASALPEVAQEPVRVVCDEVQAVGELQWRSYGPRVRATGDSGPKVIVSLDRDFLWLTVGPLKGLGPQAGVRASHELSKVAGAKVGPLYGSIKWVTATAEQIKASLHVAYELVRDLATPAAAP